MRKVAAVGTLWQRRYCGCVSHWSDIDWSGYTHRRRKQKKCGLPQKEESEWARSQEVADKDRFVDTEWERERERKREERVKVENEKENEKEEKRTKKPDQELVPSITQDGESCMCLATPPEGWLPGTIGPWCRHYAKKPPFTLLSQLWPPAPLSQPSLRGLARHERETWILSLNIVRIAFYNKYVPREDVNVFETFD